MEKGVSKKPTSCHAMPPYRIVPSQSIDPSTQPKIHAKTRHLHNDSTTLCRRTNDPDILLSSLL